jgi:hypothetical protein
MPGNSKYAGSPHAWEIEMTCTSIGGGNTTLTPKNQDTDAATTIVVNGNAFGVVGRDYVVKIDLQR